MAKTLRDTAKDVLLNKNAKDNKSPQPLDESIETGLGGQPLGQVEKPTANAKTLSPGGKVKYAPKALGGPATVQDQPHEPTEPGATDNNSENAGEKQASVIGTDDSAPTKNQAPGDKFGLGKKLMSEEEGVEISEELAAFIDGLVAEGKTEDEISEAIAENFELVSEDQEVVSESSVEIKPIDMSEHVEALLAGEDLSEEFKAKAKTIFEAAVMEVVTEELKKYEAAYEETLEEEVNQINEEVSTKVDDYLNYVVENWINENEVAVETGLRNELTEDFIVSLKNVFLEHYIDIPTDKVNVVEELASKVEELETKLNEEIEINVSYKKLLAESTKTEILSQATAGLTSTQAEKLKTLSEGVEFVDDETFATKVKTLKENYFPTTVKNDKVLDKVDGVDAGKMILEETTGPMSRYVRALGKTNRTKVEQ